MQENKPTGIARKSQIVGIERRLRRKSKAARLAGSPEQSIDFVRFEQICV